MIAGDDGEAYANQLQTLFGRLEPQLSPHVDGVLEHTVSEVLSNIKCE